MATLVVLASTGDICGAITRIDEYNLNPWDPTADWETIGGQIRNAVASAVEIERIEKEQVKQGVIDQIEEARREQLREAHPENN